MVLLTNEWNEETTLKAAIHQQGKQKSPAKPMTGLNLTL